MKKLLLFDIDGTLLHSPMNDRFTRAILNLYGIQTEANEDYNGLTDPLIMRRILSVAHWDEQRIDEALPGLMKEAERVYIHNLQKGSVKLIPGVRELLDRLTALPVVLGLATGNLQPVAQVKLHDVGIEDYFTVGGYGSDPHTERSQIVTVAMERAGYQNEKELVYLIGDTERDIAAAQQAGVANSVGVMNDGRTEADFVQAGAKIIIKDYLDTNLVLEKLGLRH